MSEEIHGQSLTLESPSPRPIPSKITKLIGKYDKTIDSKYRIGLPIQYREKLGDSPLILVRWLNRSLALFPEANWLPLAESVDALESYTNEGMTVRNYIFAEAEEVTIDKEGRIVVPPDMADFARLEGKIMLLGDWNKIIIWNYTYYRDHVAKNDVTFTEAFPKILKAAKERKPLDSIFPAPSSSES